jgi:hypothetical protein
LGSRSIADQLADITTLCQISLDKAAVKERVQHLRLTESLFNLGRADTCYAEKLLRALRFEIYPLTENTTSLSSLKEEGQFVLYDTELDHENDSQQQQLNKLPPVSDK